MTGAMGNAIAGQIYNSILNGMVASGMSENVAKTIIERAGGVNMNIGIDVPGLFHTPQLNAALFHESTLQLSNRLRTSRALQSITTLVP